MASIALREARAVRYAPRVLWWGLLAGLLALAISQPSLAVNGIFLGSIVALGAIGLSLVYGILKLANVAHGDYMTVGAYLTFFLLSSVFPQKSGLGPFTFGWPLLAAIPLSMAAVAALAVTLDTGIYRRLRRRGTSPVTMAITSLGVAIAIQGVVQMVWGTSVQHYPNISRKAYSLPFDINIAPNHIFISGSALALTLAVHLFLTRSRTGKAMRATADNAELARVTGINTQRVLWWTWALSGALAGAAGVLLVIFNATSQLTPVLGFNLLIPLFAAVVLGGIGNPYGAFLGALVVGVSSEVSTHWLEPSYKPAIGFLVLIIVLLVRPRGILGGKP